MATLRELLSSTVLVGSLVAVGLSGGCASDNADASIEGLTSTISAEQQKAMSPDQALARLTEGNRRFVSGQSLRRNLPEQREATSHGQHPFAVVLSCIDSRSAPELVFDQGLGDVFAPRIAGNFANTDIIGSMEFATKVAGARVIVVMGHSSCGAVKGAADNVQLGNLTSVVKAIRPAVESVSTVAGPRTSENTAFVQAAAEANVRRTTAKIRSESPILRDLERTGQLKIVGAMHDLASGRVTILN